MKIRITLAIVAVLVLGPTVRADTPTADYLRLSDLALVHYDDSTGELTPTGTTSTTFCLNPENPTVVTPGVCLDIDPITNGFRAIVHVQIVGTQYEVSYALYVDGEVYLSCPGFQNCASPNPNTVVTYMHGNYSNTVCEGLVPGNHLVSGRLSARDVNTGLEFISHDRAYTTCPYVL